MRSLAELQAGFAAALLAEDPAVRDAIAEDGLAPEARLAIYRHHVFTTLTAALGATFPVVARLVGDGFFRYATHHFIGRHPPSGPCLGEYGEPFPAFLAAFPAAGGLEYLADVARLEWALNLARLAEDGPPLDRAALGRVEAARVPELTFVLDPSLVLLASPWPIDLIWRANQPGADPDATVDLAAGGVRLEIRRAGDEVEIRRLDAGDYALRRALLDGLPLGQAAERAVTADPAFDLSRSLAVLLAERLLCGFRLPVDRPETMTRVD